MHHPSHPPPIPLPQRPSAIPSPTHDPTTSSPSSQPLEPHHPAPSQPPRGPPTPSPPPPPPPPPPPLAVVVDCCRDAEDSVRQRGIDALPFSSPYPTMLCKPRCPESFDQMVRQNCIIPTVENAFPRRKITGRYSILSPSAAFTASGRWCPPASPASPLNQSKKKSKKKKSKNQRKSKKLEKPHLKTHHSLSVSSSNETDLDDWFSSDDEREDEEHHETETLFSSAKSISFSSKSISLSFDSDSKYPHRARTLPMSRNHRRRRRRAAAEVAEEVAAVAVRDTFAVVKSSSDPYNDFRTSMVEMIIEKQIFGAKELEEL